MLGLSQFQVHQEYIRLCLKMTKAFALKKIMVLVWRSTNIDQGWGDNLGWWSQGEAQDSCLWWHTAPSVPLPLKYLSNPLLLFVSFYFRPSSLTWNIVNPLPHPLLLYTSSYFLYFLLILFTYLFGQDFTMQPQLSSCFYFPSTRIESIDYCTQTLLSFLRFSHIAFVNSEYISNKFLLMYLF